MCHNTKTSDYAIKLVTLSSIRLKNWSSIMHRCAAGMVMVAAAVVLSAIAIAL
jgi:hypothetical protein